MTRQTPRYLALGFAALLLPACGGETASSGNDSITRGFADGGTCQPLTLPSREVVEEKLVTTAFPVGSGGRLVDGTYVLARKVRWSTQPNSNPPTTTRSALRVRNDATELDLILVEGDGPSPDSNAKGGTALTALEGNRLTLRMLCPEQRDYRLTFTATPTRVILFEDNEQLEYSRE